MLNLSVGLWMQFCKFLLFSMNKCWALFQNLVSFLIMNCLHGLLPSKATSILKCNLISKFCSKSGDNWTFCLGPGLLHGLEAWWIMILPEGDPNDVSMSSETTSNGSEVEITHFLWDQRLYISQNSLLILLWMEETAKWWNNFRLLNKRAKHRALQLLLKSF